MSGDDWSLANSRVLRAEFKRLRVKLTGGDPAEAHQELEIARREIAGVPAIDSLTGVLGLTNFERDILLLATGVEMDDALARACAEVPESGGKPTVTFRLATARLADPHWSALTPARPLRIWRLIELGDERTPTTCRLTADERALHYIAGINYVDTRLRALLRSHDPIELLADSHQKIVDSVVSQLEARGGPTPVIQVVGDDPGAHEEMARRIAATAGLQLHVLWSTDLPASVHELEALGTLWHREAALLNSAIVIRATENLDATARFIRFTGGLVFTSSSEPLIVDKPCLRVDVDRPASAEQRKLWKKTLGRAADRMNGALDGLADQFRLRTDTLVQTARSISSKKAAKDPVTSVRNACRDALRNRIDGLAQRVMPIADWNDLVLPDSQIAALRQIAAHVRHRSAVYEDWGFASKSARGLGISVLFSGESGTGKTMAAEVLANELNLDLYRVDLATMVSKYIGETEKNLRRVFDAAEDSGTILLFDEADALFGKRSDVKESLDRYANIEVSYLLQRMEAYRGLAILTTNMKGAVDTGFLRRLRFIVQFPFPDAVQRERIWRGVFPPGVPTEAINHGKLAQLNVAGGNIRNIAMNAAFIAADARVPLNMNHLLQAARTEAAKRERPYSDAETRGWV